jgi:hypothetical protein
MLLLASLVFAVALVMAACCIGSLPVPALAMPHVRRFGSDERQEIDDVVRIDRFHHRAGSECSLSG